MQKRPCLQDAGALPPPLATARAGAAPSACQCLSANETPGSEGSEGGDPRSLIFFLPVFDEEITTSPGGAHGGPAWMV